MPRAVNSFKVCTECGEDKSVSEYHKSKSTYDGYQHRCRNCSRRRYLRDYEGFMERERLISKGMNKCNTCGSIFVASDLVKNRKSLCICKLCFEENLNNPPSHKLCIGCGKDKSSSEFGRRKSTKDGLSFYCKECKSGKAKNINTFEPTVSFKMCAGCKVEKVVRDFHKNKRSKSGLSTICKECSSIEEKKIKSDRPMVDSKVCCDCKIEKLAKDFYINKRRKDGLNGICKECNSVRFIKYRENNLEREKARVRKYMKDNPEYKKEWDEKHPGKMREYGRKYDNTHREKRNEQRRIWLKNNISARIADRLRSRVWDRLKNDRKAGSAVRDRGCSDEEFMNYLISKFYTNPKTGEMMTFGNYGYRGWHVDHIKPLLIFDLTDRNQFLEACHYTNLQPLWAKDNLKKGAKIVCS